MAKSESGKTATGNISPEQSDQPLTWRAILRILLKAAALFLLLNLLFVLLTPLETLGGISLYNRLLPGRERLPYGENSAESYNLSLNNIPAMMSSHVVSEPKAEDEFRVLIMGDSGIWGWLLGYDETLAALINSGEHVTGDGRRVVAYNLGYPIMALSKDLLLLDAAMIYDPDLIIWPVTMQSFPRDKQVETPLVQNNPERFRPLIDVYGLALDPDDQSFVEPDLIGRSIVGQRRALADLLRLQMLGFSWAATGIDQFIPDEITLRASDFEEDVSWLDIEEPLPLTTDLLAFDVLAAGIDRAGEVPVLVVNEPIFASSGQNSDLRYNAWYPRWAYDDYRRLLGEEARSGRWRYLDLWDSIQPSEFTDSPVHLTPAGMEQFANLIVEELLALANS